MPTLTVTNATFREVISRHTIVLIDWWAGWCGPCRQFAPIFEASAEEHRDIVHGTVDTEAETELTAMAQVDRFPTLMAFREGILVFAQSGFLPAGDLEEVIQQVRWLDMDSIRAQHAEAIAQQAHQVQAEHARRSEPDRAVAATAARSAAGPAPGPARYGWPGL
ncbi:thioredoxin family protein [Nocardia takedensis]|uniref:thioredoxin family protein n=1 Tax=Nocardia takedensis TaxID=259390 RepID=UPI0002F86DEA|nr:thioredoxin family protein [Nocardia takedensis]